MKPPPTITSQCGTVLGYQHHTRNRREQTCEACRAAHALKMRRYYATPEGKAAHNKYQRSAKGRAAHRRAMARYNAKAKAGA